MDNYYKIIGVKNFTSIDEIKIAYRKLSKKFHPDVNHGDEFFEEKFKELQFVYETLSDPNRRSIYDANLKEFYTLIQMLKLQLTNRKIILARQKVIKPIIRCKRF
ncbi:MAG: J domain-containing protein [Ferruginibacter sp.]